MKKPLLTKLGIAALFLASILVSLLLVEGIFRIAHVSVGTLHINRKTITLSNDPNLLYELKPNGVARAEVEYRINEHGMRNRPVRMAKAPGTRRVIVVGDSIVFGYWVPAASTLSAQLEMLMNEHTSGPERFEVLNLGVPGYNLDQQLETFQVKGQQFDPDLVIFTFCMNDLDAVSRYEYGMVVNRLADREKLGWPGRLWHLALEHSILCGWIEYRRLEMEVRRKYSQAPPRTTVHDVSPDRRRKVDVALNSRFHSLAAVLAALKLPGLLVIFPTHEYGTPDYPNQWVHEAVATAARRSSIPALDLLDCFAAYPARDTFVDPIHPNPMGHRIAAHAVFQYIATMNWPAPQVLDLSGFGDCTNYRPQDFPQVRGY